MGIKKFIQYCFICDECRNMETIDLVFRERLAIKEIRKLGWIVREDKIICPTCQREKVLGQ